MGNVDLNKVPFMLVQVGKKSAYILILTSCSTQCSVRLGPTLQVHRCVTYLDQLFITSISDVMCDEECDLFPCTSVTYPKQQAWVVLAGNFSRVGYVH